MADAQALIDASKERLKSMKPGTQDYKALAETIAALEGLQKKVRESEDKRDEEAQGNRLPTREEVVMWLEEFYDKNFVDSIRFNGLNIAEIYSKALRFHGGNVKNLLSDASKMCIVVLSRGTNYIKFIKTMGGDGKGMVQRLNDTYMSERVGLRWSQVAAVFPVLMHNVAVKFREVNSEGTFNGEFPASVQHPGAPGLYDSRQGRAMALLYQVWFSNKISSNRGWNTAKKKTENAKKILNAIKFAEIQHSSPLLDSGLRRTFDANLFEGVHGKVFARGFRHFLDVDFQSEDGRNYTFEQKQWLMMGFYLSVNESSDPKFKDFMKILHWDRNDYIRNGLLAKEAPDFATWESTPAAKRAERDVEETIDEIDREAAELDEARAQR